MMKGTVIFHHGHIRPATGASSMEAVVVRDGRIAAIGGNDSILLEYGRPDVRKVDLEGGYIYPGLADSHVHLSGVGQKRRWMDVSSCRSKEELLQAIRARARSLKPQQWILGMGWDENQMQGEIPTLEELDEASGDHPLFLIRICHHAGLVNRLAYQTAGIREGETDPEQGKWGRDEKGRFNGRVYENATRFFYDVQPKPDYTEKKETIRLAMQEALACGLTAVHTEDLRYVESLYELIRICRELREEGVWLRTHQLIYHPYLEELKESPWNAGDGDEWFRVGAMKIFADGSLGGKTAFLSRPYRDEPDHYGLLIHEPEELIRLTQVAAEQRMPVAVHAIGDQAAEYVLQAMQSCPVVHGKTGRTLRHRLIHGQFLRPDLISKLKAMPVAVDIQPRFVASDFPWVLERVEEDLMAYAYAWKTLLQSGVHLAGGSDAPIEPLHPVWGLHAAVTRRPPEEDHPGYFPREKLSLSEALALFSQGSAYAAGEEKERGRLQVGYYADMTVYDRDLFATDPGEWGKTKTRMTIVNGQVAFRQT
jgi:predicted amidohydrolase YtcJ